MTREQMVELAEKTGFMAGVIPVEEVPVDPKFRPFCAENLCGQYEANYSCPPMCGTVEEMREQLLRGEVAVVLMTSWPIKNYQDMEAMAKGRNCHNLAELRLMEVFKKEGYEGFMMGGSCCTLCHPCKVVTKEPCAHPDLRFSCVSAFCVDVAKLAEKAGLDFEWDQTKLYCYGMLVLRKL